MNQPSPTFEKSVMWSISCSKARRDYEKQPYKMRGDFMLVGWGGGGDILSDRDIVVIF